MEKFIHRCSFSVVDNSEGRYKRCFSVTSSVAAGAAGTMISAAAGTSIGGALAATTGGALVVAAAPVAIGLGAACAVGSVISWLFDD